jgi:hypothetical protein
MPFDVVSHSIDYRNIGAILENIKFPNSQSEPEIQDSYCFAM